ncbi:protein LURP-one-related 15-like [Impatiens glandulifera]|uniref:protein LURP-one-related 15-like n=1 Tax=Impatiens glandulifera TaxID=253017 RepID=UPI001FB14AC0|nr:protein LURP-one-related 15-like [Impatiens glandulifera]
MAAMAQPISYPAATSGPDPIVVVGSEFCTSYPIDIVIQRKLLTLKECNFVVTDVNGNILFQIKGKLFSLHDRRSILDAAGNPILTLHQKTITAHRRWNVFRGDDTESKNLLFSVKKSSLIQFKTELDVFMAGNTEEHTCDFKISGSWLDRSCVIYAGNTKNLVIAQMKKKHSVQSVVLGQDTYSVTVCPNVDYAFIVALVAVLEEINADRNGDD